MILTTATTKLKKNVKENKISQLKRATRNMKIKILDVSHSINLNIDFCNFLFSFPFLISVCSHVRRFGDIIDNEDEKENMIILNCLTPGRKTPFYSLIVCTLSVLSKWVIFFLVLTSFSIGPFIVVKCDNNKQQEISDIVRHTYCCWMPIFSFSAPKLMLFVL